MPRNTTPLTEEIFKEIKDKLLAGMSLNRAQLEFRRGTNTIHLIKNSQTFAEYEEKAAIMKREHAQKYYAPTGERISKYTNPITEEEFNTIKELSFQGHTKQEIREMTGRAYQTIHSVQASPSFAEYKFIIPKRKHTDTPAPLHSGTLSQRIATAVEKIVREELEQNLNDYHKGFMEKLTKGDDN